jgi:hypothetical protein
MAKFWMWIAVWAAQHLFDGVDVENDGETVIAIRFYRTDAAQQSTHPTDLEFFSLEELHAEVCRRRVPIRPIFYP